MLLEQIDRSRDTTREGLAGAYVPERSAVRAFVEAVLALSHDPQAANVERYLVASDALEDSRSRSSPPARRAA